MTAALAVRAHLYAELRGCRRPRRRRALRRQIAVLSSATARPDDGGAAGVREPRRPLPAPPGQSSSAL